ncbi:MAG: hypothetical protein QGG40_03715 [Myxococcota bacterium]|nr:hypothetical protein [Myxococcota bacterium]
MHTMGRSARMGLVLLLVGCEAVDSSDILTDGIHAELTASSDGDETEAKAILRVGGSTSNTYVNMGGDDQLTVTVGEETEKLREQHIGDYYYYTATVDHTAADSEFSFAFERTIDEGAPSSLCSLPEGFEITGPEEDTTVSRSTEDLTVTWEEADSGDDIVVFVESECAFNEDEDVSGDPGSFTFEAGSIESYSGYEDEACAAMVGVIRKRSGSLDAGFGEGGSIHGVQIRMVEIRLDP